MSAVLFLSPHLDDAVFSCAGKILEEIGNGAHVVVATIFSACGAGQANQLLYKIRRKEDKAAIRSLGATERWLGFPDAPFRNPFYDSFRRIIFERAPEDLAYVDEIGEAIDRLCTEIRPVKIYCPLGVGTHIDHRLTFASAAQLQSGIPIVYYEDRPYAFVRYAVRLRLARLGAVLHGTEQSDFNNVSQESLLKSHLWSFRRASYVQRYLSDRTARGHCEGLLAEHARTHQQCKLQIIPAVLTPITEQLPIIEKAIFSYESQVDPFLKSRMKFHRDVTSYSRSLGFRGRYVERVWTRRETTSQISES